MTVPKTSQNSRVRLAWAFAIAYLLLLAYGSLYPLTGWDGQRGGLMILLRSFSLKHLSRSDIITNLVVYMPLGLLLVLAWRDRLSTRGKIIAATLCGVVFSLVMEYLQSYLPARVSSLVDATLNGIGTLIGALLAQSFAAHTYIGTQLQQLRQRLFLPGPMASLGLAVMGVWTLSQLTPLVPSLDRGTLVDGIRPILNTLRGLAAFNADQALIYGLNTAAVGLIAATLVKTRQQFLTLFSTFIAAVLVLKIPIVSRQLSLEAIAGAVGALLILPVLLPLAKNTRSLLAGLMVLLAYALEQLHAGAEPHAALHVMNWIPFRDQMQNLGGFEDIVNSLWPFASLAYLVRLHRLERRRTIIGGVLLVFSFTFVLEWLQSHIPGRYADITDVCLAVLGWCLPWLFPIHQDEIANITATAAAPPPRTARRILIGITASTVAVATLFVGWSFVYTTPEAPLDESALPQLPAPEQLAPVSLPHFLVSHPRLPAPTPEDIARLRRENMDYLNMHRRFAEGGGGKLDSTILMAYVEPGSQDLTKLM